MNEIWTFMQEHIMLIGLLIIGSIILIIGYKTVMFFIITYRRIVATIALLLLIARMILLWT